MARFSQLTPPDGVLPGHLGVILEARVLMTDIAATVVDLAQRQVIRVQETPGSGWQISAPASRASQRLAGYEKTLVKALPATAAPLDHIEDSVPLDTRKALIRDAVSRGWLRHLHHDLGTPASEDLASQIRTFRRQLAQHVQQAGPPAPGDALLPYAIRLDLVTEDDTPLARLAHAWTGRFTGLPGWRDARTGATLTGAERDLRNAAALLDAINLP